MQQWRQEYNASTFNSKFEQKFIVDFLDLASNETRRLFIPPLIREASPHWIAAYNRENS